MLEKTINKHVQFLKVQDNNFPILNKTHPYCFYNQLNIRNYGNKHKNDYR